MRVGCSGENGPARENSALVFDDRLSRQLKDHRPFQIEVRQVVIGLAIAAMDLHGGGRIVVIGATGDAACRPGIESPLRQPVA